MKSKKRPNSRQGYHRCEQAGSYGTGYNISARCTREPVPIEPGYTGIRNRDTYTVSLLVYGSPVRTTKQMHANVYPSGNIYFYS